MKVGVTSGAVTFAPELEKARRLGFQLQAASTPVPGGGLMVQARAVPVTQRAREACERASAGATAIEAQAQAESSAVGLDVLRECIAVVLERAKEVA